MNLKMNPKINPKMNLKITLIINMMKMMKFGNFSVNKMKLRMPIMSNKVTINMLMATTMIAIIMNMLVSLNKKK